MSIELTRDEVEALRQKARLGQMTLEDQKKAVMYLREKRGKARPMEAPSTGKAAKVPVDTNKLLEGL